MNTLNKLRQIKLLRMKPEERFLADILNRAKIGFNENYPDSTFYVLDNKIVFEYIVNDDINNRLRCRHGNVWSILETKYRLSFTDIQKLFLSNNILKLEQLTIIVAITKSYKGVWDSLKINFK